MLELTNPAFYHLDTCLCLLTHDTAMIVRSALTASGQDLIEALIPNVIEVPEKEGLEQFACNAHCPDGTTVVIQAGCQTTVARLRERGFEIAEIETSEFIKAGGSVFCMKQMFW